MPQARSDLTPRQQLLAATPWRVWQDQVIMWANTGGWRVYAINDSRTQHWATDTGFPDVLLLRGGRQIVAELKCGTGRTRKDQREWLEAFAALQQHDGCPGVEVYVWRPEHGDEIRALLLSGMQDIASRASMAQLPRTRKAPTRERRGFQQASRRSELPRASVSRVPE